MKLEDAVSVVMATMSVARRGVVADVKTSVDCETWSTPCSGLTTAIAKTREITTETAIREANASSILSWPFKDRPRASYCYCAGWVTVKLMGWASTYRQIDQIIHTNSGTDTAREEGSFLRVTLVVFRLMADLSFWGLLARN